VDQRRLADVRAGTPDESRRGGTGYLIGQCLVLTARHVVVDDDGRVWPRVEVRLGGQGTRRSVGAMLVWQDSAHDAAMLRVEGVSSAGVAPVRWGWFAGTDPVEYGGLGFPQFADYESGRGVEQLRGSLPPLAAGADGGYVLDQAAAPEASAGRAWPGVSGAAVFCAGLLTAVVHADDEVFGNRRLHAVPAHVLLADPEFVRLVAADTGTLPVLEAVELKEILQPPVGQAVARTPGSLLGAAVEAVHFTGRDEELGELEAWRDDPALFTLMLITGEGGQGKTRLAREFVARSRRAGWAAGFAAGASFDSAADNGGSHARDAREMTRRLRGATVPVLVVADYAETRAADVAALADELSSDSPGSSVRLLLLSRSVGSWWHNLTEALGGEITSHIALAHLTSKNEERRAAYTAAVTGLARRLAELPDPPVEGDPGQSWEVLAQRMSENPPDLDDPRLGNVLTLHMTALAGLLTAAAGHEPVRLGEPVGAELVRHERAYLHRAAARRRLFEQGVLSARTDDDERIREAKSILDRALAAIILFGPCGPGQANSSAALASATKAEDVEAWLAALYPPPGEGFRIGTVQPDRLAELVLGPILIQQTSLLGQTAALANSGNDAIAALFALMRTAAHPEFASVGDQAADLIVNHPAPFAEAAPVLAARIPQAAPLREGLLRLGRQDPQAFRQHAYIAADQLPVASVGLAFFSAALTGLLTDVIRTLAQESPATYLPDLGAVLNNLGVRLAATGQRAAALATARQAVTVYRQLTEAHSDAYQSDLAGSLNNFSHRLADTGQFEAALAPAQESVSIRRELAETNPDVYRPELASSLHSLANRLADTRQREAALAAAQEAVDIRRGLMAANPDAHRSDLAGSLAMFASRLADSGQREAALAPAREAVDIYRFLAEMNPDAYLPELATSLHNLANRLGETGQPEDALAAAQDAVSIRRELAEANPDVYRPDLAASLHGLAIGLAQTGRLEEALKPAQEAVSINRELAEASPDLYLASLTGSVATLVGALVDAGQLEAALTLAREAADLYRGLAAASPDAYLPALAGSVTTLVGTLVDTGRRQAALAPAREAADLYRGLAEVSPDAYLPDLAESLSTLASLLADTGQQDAARASAQEAVVIYRGLAEANPGAYLPDLARSLNNLADVLANTGQRDAACAPVQEAVAIYRGLAEEHPDVYLPKLAGSLNNFAARLSQAQQVEAALPAAQEAVTIRRKLAEVSPSAHLPDLAMSLGNLAHMLADTGQQDAALAPAREAVSIYGQLADADPDAYLPDLAMSLGNLALKLADSGHRDDAAAAWKSAVAGLAEESSRLSLTVAYARFLLHQRHTDDGVRLLVTVLTAPAVPGPVEAESRHLLRSQWRQDSRAPEEAWRAASSAPLPNWVSLTDEDFEVVIGWINIVTGWNNARNWGESHDYFQAHARQLMAPATDIVLDELALRIPAELVGQHRALLATARKAGIAAAYQPLLLACVLREWIMAPDWDTSRAFLRDHPEFLDQDVSGILAQLGADASGADIAVHQALLILATGPAGIDGAYRCVTGQQELGTQVTDAIRARNPDRLHACAAVEALVHAQAFAGTFHAALARLMADPAVGPSEELLSQLTALAAEADTGERDRAKAQLGAVLADIPAGGDSARHLRKALG
jgi:hypothetical protein